MGNGSPTQLQKGHPSGASAPMPHFSGEAVSPASGWDDKTGPCAVRSLFWKLKQVFFSDLHAIGSHGTLYIGFFTHAAETNQIQSSLHLITFHTLMQHGCGEKGKLRCWLQLCCGGVCVCMSLFAITWTKNNFAIFAPTQPCWRKGQGLFSCPPRVRNTFVLGVFSLSLVILQWRPCGRSSRGDFGWLSIFRYFTALCQKTSTFLFVLPRHRATALRGKESVCQVRWGLAWYSCACRSVKKSERLVANASPIAEGSLEVKLPTIWTDEKQSREEAERRERLEERRVEEKE